MAKAETATRAPRGSKPVSQAFFAALDSVPEASRAAVARAAQVMIRDELKLRREKLRASAAKEKARKPHAKAKLKQADAEPVRRGRGKPSASKAAA